MSAHSPLAEQNVIGACLISDSAFWEVSDLITTSDFFDGWCREMWALIGDLRKANQPADAVTIGELAQTRGSNHGVDFASVVQCANNTPSANSVRAYAEVVASKAVQRRVADAGAKIAKLTGDDALMDAQAILGGVSDNLASPTTTAKQAMKQLVKLMHEQTERTTELLGVPTGFPMLDDMTAGLRAGDLVLIAGRPSMGKSLLAMQLALNSAREGFAAHVVSLEMPVMQCVQRMVSCLSEVPFEHVMDAKKIQEWEWARVANAESDIAALNLFFDDDVYDLPKILARIRQVHAAHNTRVVVVDYLSFIRAPSAERNDLAIQAITRELKATAKALGITVILVAQLNRGVEKRSESDKRPVMSDLRESGAIEQDADLIMMCYRDGYYNPESPHKDFAEILIRKQRNGRTGMVPLLARLDIQRFQAAPDGLPHIAKKEPEKKKGFEIYAGGRAGASHD